MIARWHVPFACANENAGLLVARHRKIPSLILDRVGCWDKCHCRAIVVRSGAGRFPSMKQRRRDVAVLTQPMRALTRENRCSKGEAQVCFRRGRGAHHDETLRMWTQRKHEN